MHSILVKFGRLLYTIWFYVLAALPILIFSPILIVFSLSERTYPQLFWMARNVWANTILYGMGCIPKITHKENIKKGNSYMFIANHTSMLDIMLMLKCTRNPFVFVGKKELVKIPIFGFFYKRASIMVDRESRKSRTGVYLRAQKRLATGLSIGIFPEGGVPDESVLLDAFKDGAFSLAIEHKIPIVPIVFYDCKRRFPFSLNGGSPGRLRATVFPFYRTDSLSTKDIEQLKNTIREKIRSELLEQ
ncbi:MAG: 1-acyl-sn-glycerol-3-phosphate acyltransferase [Eudoraea sp.]|nr:1-acyl-sn-glycerol-3-phosphate acyltransferase [Eudoraea sp.]